MIKVTIVEPNISKEENDKQLMKLRKTIQDIVRNISIRQNEKTRK